MDRLEVPRPLPGLDVDRDQGLREEVVAEAVDAVVVVGRRPRRQVHVAELVVAGEHRPDVGVARVAPRVVQPGVDPELVGAVGHGVEVPRVLAGPDVPGPDPARDRLLGDAAVGDVRAVDDAVAHHDGRRVDAEEHRVQVVALVTARPRQPHHRVDPAAAVPEVGARPARLRVDADQVAVAGAPEDALVSLAVGPVGDAPLRPRVAHGRGALFVALRVVDPEGLAGRRVDGDALRERGVEVEHAADHQRRRLQPARERPVAGPVEVGGVGDERVDDGVEGRPPLAAAGGRPAHRRGRRWSTPRRSRGRRSCRRRSGRAASTSSRRCPRHSCATRRSTCRRSATGRRPLRAGRGRLSRLRRAGRATSSRRTRMTGA